MRILIVSDTHRKHGNLEAVLEKEGPIDLFIHAGDVEEEYDIDAMIECPKHIVAGNNDYFTYLPKEKEFCIGKYKVFLTHGHNYRLYAGTQYLEQAARQRKVDIVIYGHTHRPNIEYKDGLILINPGSISEPRQMGRDATYIMAEVDSKGQISFEMRNL